MKNLTIENIAKAVCGEIFACGSYEDKKDIEAASVVIDSRKVEENGVFIATRGERVDGHSFITQVWEKGILCAIGEEPYENLDFTSDLKRGIYIKVDDSFVAIKKLARYYRSVLDIRIVGITGSVGKTSTKEMVASVLSKSFRVQKTMGNFNNEVGVPLTIFSIRDEHEIAVVEMGISDFGEMTRLTDIVKPDVCVLTNIGPCHLEFLHDLDGVLKAKSEIFTSMSKDGNVFVNGDDEKLRTINEVNGKPPVRFGLKNEDNEIFATGITSLGISGTKCTIHTPEGNFDAIIPLPGVHMVDNALAGTAVGLDFGMSLAQIKAGIESVAGLSGRSNLIRTKEYLIVDDCYNANPKAMASAIDLIVNAKGRKVAILGDMFELGEGSIEMHKKIGIYAIEKGVDFLICCGEHSKYMYEAAVEEYEERMQKAMKRKKTAPLVKPVKEVIRYYANRELLELSIKKEKLFMRDDNILIKASHGMGFDKLVDFLKEESR